MSPSRIQTEYGAIIIDNEVIAKIAGLSVMECCGIVGMAAKNVRDGLVQLLKMENLTKGVRLLQQDECLIIELHIIVEYGTNISAIAEALVNNVKYRVENYTGLAVLDVKIFVEGVRVDQ